VNIVDRVRRTPEARMVRVVNYRGRPFWIGTLAWIAFFVFPLVPGWLLAELFRHLQGGATGTRFWVTLTALLLSEAAAVIFIRWGHTQYMQGLHAAVTLVRANALAGQLAGGGPEAARRRLNSGDALARLRDDPLDMVNVLDNWTDLAGSLVYGAGVVWMLGRIDPWAAFVGILPMFLIGAANTRLGQVARRFRQRARATTSTVTGFLGAVFAASLTVKLAGAQRHVVNRLDGLNARRSRAMVADQLWEDSVWSVNGTLTDVSVGMALIVAARGPLDAGEVTLFASYLFSLVWLPQRLGGLIVGRRRYDVSAARIGELTAVPSQGYDPVTVHRPMPVLDGPPPPAPVAPARVPLRRLDICGLTVAARGLHDVSFTVGHGELVVVTGPVGSGKSSLLRAVIGLVPPDRGEIRWNDRVVEDPAAFFVPPRAAYVAQVPHLFAETLTDNLALGRDVGDDDLVAALSLAAFDEDLAVLPHGLGTLIGSRGVRLSGGQAQRLAAARAFVHRPELLVLDDLASALDLDTEIALWDRLRAVDCTILTATNRAATLRRADRVVRLG
jgi:ATP-binding cassette, subfamily B, bacterial